MRWVASLLLSCLGIGWSIGEAIARMIGQTGIPLDTERTVFRDYGFLVWLGNLVMAVVCPNWLGHDGVGGCTAHMAGLLLGWATCQVVPSGGCEILW